MIGDDVLFEMLVYLGAFLFSFIYAWAGYHGLNYPVAIPGGFLMAFGFGVTLVWLSGFAYPVPIIALLIPLVVWTGMAVRAAIVWQLSDVNEHRWPRSYPARPYWNMRRFAGWWAVTCATLVGLLVQAIATRGSVLG